MMTFMAMAASFFGVDWYLKRWAQKNLPDGQEKKVAGGRILLRKLYNPGVALGTFEKWPQAVLVGSAMIMGAIFREFFRLLQTPGNRLSKLGYALLAGGGMNNLADRACHGCVTDYFSFSVKWERFRKIVFNVSDLFIVLGAFLTVIGGLFRKEER